jgi:5-methylcytosine-specific restriction endonuclease McrA
MKRKQRVVNKRLLRRVADNPCIICFKDGPSDACHIKSKGSGGPDKEWNVLPMCRKCHGAQHQLGVVTFYEKIPMYRLALRARGWTIENGRLWNEKLEPGKDDSFNPDVDKDGDF